MALDNVSTQNRGEGEVSSPLFTSSSLILLQFVGDFSSFHRNLLCSVCAS